MVKMGIVVRETPFPNNYEKRYLFIAFYAMLMKLMLENFLKKEFVGW